MGAQFDGYKMQMINEQTQIPRVITIFSAPNYCDVYKNKGACLKFDDELLNIRQFVSSPHPYYLPNFMDVFTWSLPFVAEKVTDMLYSILSYENTANLDGVDLDESKVVTQSGSTVLKNKGGVLKTKVQAVTKLMRMYKVLKENQNNIVKLKQLSPNNKLPTECLPEDPRKSRKCWNRLKAQRERIRSMKYCPMPIPIGSSNRMDLRKRSSFPRTWTLKRR